MTAVTDTLPLTETTTPDDQPALAAAMRAAFASGTPMYPLGGGTSLDYGLPPTRPGLGISLSRLARVIDYPARDMTITVEPGITMAALAETLAAEKQGLPIDVPQLASATLGGVIATAWSGPRRYGCGTMRDYVIGILAIDGRGTPFKAGGRVVKNVAGYDFCKLLTGSLGTLGVISQVTLKVKPLSKDSALLAIDLDNLDTAERLLAALVQSATTPTAIELLAGPAWSDHPALGLLTAGEHVRLVVGLEGAVDEVAWMTRTLSDEWRALGAIGARAIHGAQAAAVWRDLAEFPAAAEAPLVLKASILPSHVTRFVALVREIDPQATIQAHAGNGIVIVRLSQFDAGDVSRILIGRLQPAAALAGGHAIVLSTTVGGLTRQAVWGGVTADMAWMSKVKSQFDPQDLLNPGRFIYAD
ncbi:MAG: FAD-binding oxidoreductase [Pirellulales bacterium]